jgi:hypothetical protein
MSANSNDSRSRSRSPVSQNTMSAPAFNKKASELADTMQRSGVSGYGNVLTVKKALLEKAVDGEVTLAALQELVEARQYGLGPRVHNWMHDIIEKGDCSYIEYIKQTKRARWPSPAPSEYEPSSFDYLELDDDA